MALIWNILAIVINTGQKYVVCEYGYDTNLGKADAHVVHFSFYINSHRFLFETHGSYIFCLCLDAYKNHGYNFKLLPL